MTPYEEALHEVELADYYDAALAAYEDAIETAPDLGLRAATCMAAAAVCHELEQLDRVQDFCDDTLAGPLSDLLRGKVIGVSAEAAHAAGNAEEALELYAQAIELLLRDPGGHASAHLAVHKVAKLCADLERWEDADRWLARGIEIFYADASKLHTLLGCRACVMINLGRFADAATALRECLAIPAVAVFHTFDRFKLVGVLVENGQPAEAIPFAESPTEVAMLLLESGRLDEADQAYAAALEGMRAAKAHPQSRGMCAIRAGWAAVKEARGETKEAEALRAEIDGDDITEFDPKVQLVGRLDRYRSYSALDAQFDPALPLAVAVEVWRAIAPGHSHLAFLADVLVMQLPKRGMTYDGQHDQMHDLYQVSSQIRAREQCSQTRLHALCDAAAFDAKHGYYDAAVAHFRAALADYHELRVDWLFLVKAAVNLDFLQRTPASPRQIEDARAVAEEIAMLGDAQQASDDDSWSSLLYTRRCLAELAGAPADAVRLHAEWMACWNLERGDRFDALRTRLRLLALAGQSDAAADDECRTLQHAFAEEAFASALSEPSPIATLLPALRDYVRVENPTSSEFAVFADVVRLVDMPTDVIHTIRRELGDSFLDDTHNAAPSPREMLAVTETHASETTFGGFIVLPPRDDARITIDKVVTPITDAVRAWKDTADDFRELGSRVTCWWD